MVRLVLILLSVSGLAVSALFSVMERTKDKNFIRIPARVCRLSAPREGSTMNNRFARLFGILNSDAGIIYYLFMLLGLSTTSLFRRLHPVLLLQAGGAVVIGIYLMYVLIAVLKEKCYLCSAVHSINAVTFAILLATGS